jgi:hypothetical protein
MLLMALCTMRSEDALGAARVRPEGREFARLGPLPCAIGLTKVIQDLSYFRGGAGSNLL